MKHLILALAVAGALAFTSTAEAGTRGYGGYRGGVGRGYTGGYRGYSYGGYRGGYASPRYYGGGYRAYPAYRPAYYGAYPYGYGYQPGLSLGIGGPNGSFGVIIR